jgi:hypothetical protein
MRRNKGRIVFVTACALLFSLIMLLSGTGFAALDRDELTKAVGDEWEFRNTEKDGMISLFTIEVTGEDKIEIDEDTYDVYIARGDGEIEDVGEIDPDLSLVEGSDLLEITVYYSKDETAQQSIMDFTFELEDETSGTIYEYSLQSISTEKLTSGAYPDIIDVGTTWSLTVKETINQTTTISGGIFGDGEHAYYNDTTTSTINFECLNEKSVTVTAGTFNTYEIQRTVVGEEGNYSLEYISPEVKREVKSVDYDNDDQILSIMELISYAVVEKDDENGGIAGFELIVIIGAVAMILILRNIRKPRS